MFKEVTINNIKVEPVIVKDPEDISNVKGYKLIPKTIFSIFLCAYTESGKTSVINTILQKCMTKKTVIWLFVATYRIDDAWIQIIKRLKSKGFVVNCFDSLMDGKENLLMQVIDGLEQIEGEEEEEEDKDKTDVKPKVIFEDPKAKEKKEYKPKKKSCKNLFILDDMSTELKNPAVAKLLKEHRHSGSSVIISSQYLHDIRPETIIQLRYLFLFKSLTKEKLEILHNLARIKVPFETFWDIYNHVTTKPYGWLYYNMRNSEMRSTFDKKIELEN